MFTSHHHLSFIHHHFIVNEQRLKVVLAAHVLEKSYTSKYIEANFFLLCVTMQQI